MESVLEDYATEIPGPVYEELKSHLLDATTAAKDEEEAALQQIALLGPLATAGIAAVAYQHELKKQFAFVEKIVVRLRKIKSGSDMLQQNLSKLADDLEAWLHRARATNSLFDPLSDPENSHTRERLRVGPVVQEVVRQTEFLARGIEIDTDELSADLRLPSHASLVSLKAADSHRESGHA